MKHEITDNGNLRISLEPEDDKEELIALYQDLGEIRFLSQLLELTGWRGNGKLYEIQPEDVGGITDAPMLCDDVEYSDSGDVEIKGSVYWFPNYMVESWPDTLLAEGSVIFTKAQ